MKIVAFRFLHSSLFTLPLGFPYSPSSIHHPPSSLSNFIFITLFHTPLLLRFFLQSRPTLQFSFINYIISTPHTIPRTYGIKGSKENHPLHTLSIASWVSFYGSTSFVLIPVGIAYNLRMLINSFAAWIPAPDGHMSN